MNPLDVDVFSAAWQAGYVLGRRPHGPSQLPEARERAADLDSAASFDDGYDAGLASAARLPHRTTLHDYLEPRPLDGTELELDLTHLQRVDTDVFTADPVFLEACDDDGQLLWSARAHVVRADLTSSRVAVYIERSFE